MINELYTVTIEHAKDHGWKIVQEYKSQVSESRYFKASRGQQEVKIRVSDHISRSGNWDYQVTSDETCDDLLFNLWFDQDELSQMRARMAENAKILGPIFGIEPE